MDDPISRQAAIDVIFSEPLYKSGMKKRYADEVVHEIYEKIKQLPSVEAFEIGKTYPLDGYEFEIKKGECGNDFVTIRRRPC